MKNSLKLLFLVGCLSVCLISVSFVLRVPNSLPSPNPMTSTSKDATDGTQKGCVIETLSGQKLFVTEISAANSKKYNLKKGDFADNIKNPEIIRNIKVELRDAYTVRCRKPGTMTCKPVDWTICPASGCPPAGLQGEIKR